MRQVVGKTEESELVATCAVWSVTLTFESIGLAAEDSQLNKSFELCGTHTRTAPCTSGSVIRATDED